MRILVVEDEVDLQEAIAEGLRLDGYAVDTCGDGRTAYELLYVEDYDLVILEDTSFPFPDKGLVCVLGPSGSGKSILLKQQNTRFREVGLLICAVTAALSGILSDVTMILGKLFGVSLLVSPLAGGGYHPSVRPGDPVHLYGG